VLADGVRDRRPVVGTVGDLVVPVRMVRADVWTADAPWSLRAGLAEQSSEDVLFNRGLGADVLLPVHLPVGWPVGLMSGQLSYDRSERVGEVGAEDEVGEADLLPSPLDLLGGCRRVIRKYRHRVRRA
jgi:hypothetical protein